jgi:hypothetical protein
MIYFRHRKYSFEVSLYQMKRSRSEFLNTHRPILKKCGLKEIQSGSAYIKKDTTDDLIERIAIGLARDKKPTEEQRRGMYIHGGVLYFDHIMQMHYRST